VEVPLPEHLGAVRGRVLDEAGSPAAEAVVWIASDGSAGMRRSAATDSNGRFTLAPLVGPLVDLDVRARGHAPRIVRAVPVGGEPIEVRLGAGAILRVEVRDSAGELVDGGTLQTELPPPPPRVQRDGPGLYSVHDLGPGPVPVVLHLAGRKYEREHDPAEGTLVIEVPAHGSLEVRWPEGLEGTVAALVLRSHADGLELKEQVRLPRRIHVLQTVLPGRYDVTLFTAAAGTRDWKPACAPAQVDVVAGQQAQVELRP
jgi:hypothetical protein